MPTTTLRSIPARELGALSLCPDFVERAARHEAWWRHASPDGRPLLLGSANRDPSRPITRRLELLDEPARWAEAKWRDVQQMALATDALPFLRVDFGPCCLPAFIGLPREYGADTGWSHAFLRDDWSNSPPWGVDRQCLGWRQLETLLEVAATRSRGHCVMATPNLGSFCDILSNLRGATELCMDVVDQPERILAAAEAMRRPYEDVFAACYAAAVRHRVGLVHWHVLWSDVPYVISECDLSFSVGPEDWQRVCCPEIEFQSRLTSRSVFHLDGAGSARHIDALLEIPTIQAVQYTPGAGTPSALAWLDMFRRIQDRGRSVLIFAPIDEVPALARALRPEGLAIQVEGARDEVHLAAVCATVAAEARRR